jgi:hypothetical protein
MTDLADDTEVRRWALRRGASRILAASSARDADGDSFHDHKRSAALTALAEELSARANSWWTRRDPLAAGPYWVRHPTRQVTPGIAEFEGTRKTGWIVFTAFLLPPPTLVRRWSDMVADGWERHSIRLTPP